MKFYQGSIAVVFLNVCIYYEFNWFRNFKIWENTVFTTKCVKKLVCSNHGCYFLFYYELNSHLVYFYGILT